MSQSTVVSAPGKVLVAGGYLVLEPAFSGTVVSTSSRFYTVVTPKARKESQKITVRSPQFLEATWTYDVGTGSPLEVTPAAHNTSKNKFVHLALRTVLSLAAGTKAPSHIQELLSTGINITIVGDNDFYSQSAKLASLNLPRTLKSLSQLPPFNPLNVHLADVHKTGLGSSAALITALVSALLLHFGLITETTFADAASADRRFAHNVAQYVHCLAQGKIGSGFDVAAAAFGTHIYTRFDPSVLKDLLSSDTPSSQTLYSVLSPSNPAWDYKVEPFKLPPLTRIMLADVNAGSDTPSLVGKVLSWRKANKETSDKLWETLHQHNRSLATNLQLLTRLSEQDPENYASAVKYLASLQPVQWAANPWQPPEEIPIVEKFYGAHRITQDIRQNMKRMGELAGVPIEPPEQTSLLDKCVTQAGIIGGGVPGAGGYDAIWLLVCNPVDCSPELPPVERVEYLWSKYDELKLSPLSAEESHAGGARKENIDDIPGLKDIIVVV
ncbi:phosphomevalonate kinase [Pluteus cervinus]|uniref:Phosphomevalonate kinase n=1 Tax=Pluteus cervinus TaxID=181527 RepID=A0ACD3BCS1_9AGAR|nr:phosphomevalonate kinase [Pluteus cervinus]